MVRFARDLTILLVDRKPEKAPTVWPGHVNVCVACAQYEIGINHANDLEGHIGRARWCLVPLEPEEIAELTAAAETAIEKGGRDTADRPAK
jgi:hypothetical protein